jgi:hypothetical protein
MSIIRREQLTTPLSASYAETASVAISSSYALTASYAENAGVSIDTGSLVTTSSFNAYTASINSFTSSINTFTASYNTGSFTGSFTGNLIGTSSWAENAISSSNALTASYVNPLQQDVQLTGSLLITGSQIIFSGSQFEMTNNIIVNPTTRRLNSGSALSVDWGVRGLYSTGNVLSVDWQNRILRVGGNTSVDWANYQLIDNNASQSIAWASRIIYTSNSTIALSWADDITNFSQTYLFRTYSDIQQNSFANISKIQPSGEIIQTNVSGSSLIHNLVALSGSIWVPVNQQLDVSTLMLGIALSTDENNKDTVLLEGDIQFNGVDGPNIQGITTNTQGLPVYIRLGVAEGRMSIIPPTSGYVRIVGHVYYEKTGSFIFKFRPSNDWYKLS